jgi:hypothetical protein
MSVKGYLVFVPFGNVASMEYGNDGAPDKVTVATTPGHLAGPFEVEQTVQDEVVLAEALRSAVKAGALRDQEAIGHLINTCAVSPETAAGLIRGSGSTDAGEMFYVLACLECGDPDRPLPMPFGSPAERGKWASEHTRATGHDRWIVKDQRRAGETP